jgi:hypothetical protein
MYWEELRAHKFLLAPWGRGLQSPKFFEGFMVRTVSVTLSSPAFEDLRQMGFPFVLVKKWEELTKEYLEGWYHEHYHHINWNEIRNLMRVETIDKIIRGEYPDCIRHEVKVSDQKYTRDMKINWVRVQKKNNTVFLKPVNQTLRKVQTMKQLYKRNQTKGK